jgi:hypothetical protein
VVWGLGPVVAAGAEDRPHYDVPAGFAKCPRAQAWHGFFKWASERGTTCARASAFIHAYARAAADGPMPRHVRGFRCRIRFWRDEQGDLYASRHRCTRRAQVIRFYATA